MFLMTSYANHHEFNVPLLFHVTWTTFKSSRNQLGTVSAFVMISVPWSNQRAHQVNSEKLLSKEFHCRTYGPQVNTENCVH